jgi:hypothetical protein
MCTPAKTACDANDADNDADVGSPSSSSSCTDLAQNGDETGVDCGGSCPFACVVLNLEGGVVDAKKEDQMSVAVMAAIIAGIVIAVLAGIGVMMACCRNKEVMKEAHQQERRAADSIYLDSVIKQSTGPVVRVQI